MKLLVVCSIALGAVSTDAFVPSQQRIVGGPVSRSAVSSSTRAFANRQPEASTNEMKKNFLQNFDNVFKASVVAVGISLAAFTSPAPAMAADSGSIVSCLFSKCQVPLAKCVTNPKCLANVICINTCNGKEDEIGCQVKCGDLFDNEVIGEFNKCVVSDMACVKQQADDGSYPVPAPEKLVPEYDTKMWNGKWYITAGQNPLFDIFPCQVHFFTNPSPGTFYGKLNWRVTEPDGEYFTRDALQQFIQDPKQPAHLINHDNEFLHYKDDWYIIDYEYDDNTKGVPPFAFVYYRGSNDAWDGYGGVFVYTRESKLPESLIPRMRVAAQKVGFDWDKDFTVTDNTCPTMAKGDAAVLRQKFAGKVLLQTEELARSQATMVRGNAMNSLKAQKVFFSEEGPAAGKAYEELQQGVQQFEKEQAAKNLELSK